MSKPINLLLIDDSPDSRYLTRYILQKHKANFEIAEAGNGREAIEYLQNRPHPDVILLDICMPVLDGFEFLIACKRLCLLAPTTLVYILSSSTLELERQKFNETGMVRDFFEKPLTTEAVDIVVNGALFVALARKKDGIPG